MRATRTLLAASAVAVISASFVPAASAATKKPADPTLTVMTRNVYLGGDIAEPVAAKTPAEFAQKNSSVLATVKKNNFALRAKYLVGEIADTKPDLIGLQEVIIASRTPDGTAGTGASASIPLYDYLKTLQAELRKRRLKYTVVVNQPGVDVRGPTTEGYDARLILRDVILVKRQKSLSVRRKGFKQYKTSFTVPSAIGPIPVKRGYSYADVTYQKRKFRFLNTHLESFLDSARVAQSKELVAKGGPARVKTPLIMTGDLNSDPRGRSGDLPGAYRALRGFGLKDSWAQVHGNAPGLGCCHSKTLDGPPPADDPPSRIDYVLYKGGNYRATKAVLTGVRPRPTAPKWGSDHSGLVVKLKLKR